jgi:hypothetical protein
VLTHSTIPQFRVAVWQPSASMRTQAREGLSVNEIIGLHGLIYPAGFPYELVPEEYFADGARRSATSTWFPARRGVSERGASAAADRLRAGGGTLIAIEPPGVRDELTRPSGLLLREVFGIEEVAFDAEGAQWSWRSDRCPLAPLAMAEAGEGRAYLTPSTLLRAIGDAPGPEAIVELLAERVRREAWAENARFEVIIRVTDEGERFLFAINPSADERLVDRVLLAADVSAATDVSVQGGFEVPVARQDGRAAIELTLGAGEMAVLWLR